MAWPQVQVLVLPLEMVVAGGGVVSLRVAPVMTETRMTKIRATASITRVLLRTPYLGSSSSRQKIRRRRHMLKRLLAHQQAVWLAKILKIFAKDYPNEYQCI